MASMFFRQRKWRYWFKILDVDCDRSITLEDWHKMADDFIEGQSLGRASAIKARSAMLDWATLVFGLSLNEVEQVTEEQFVRMLANFHQQNPKYAQDIVEELYQKMLDLSDHDKDGFVTEDEFVALNKAFGFEEESSRRLYHFIGPPEDHRGIETETLLDFWLEFLLGEDKIIFKRMTLVINGEADFTT